MANPMSAMKGLTGMKGLPDMNAMTGLPDMNAMANPKDMPSMASLSTAATIAKNSSPAGMASGMALDKVKGLWKIFLKLFRMDTFKILVSLLLFMAYLMFALATILFVNAIVNLHKTTDNKPKKLKELPIFDYLKSNNFMFLDTAILNFKTSILFKVIVGIVSGAVGLLAIHLAVWYYSKNDEGGGTEWTAFMNFYKKELRRLEVYIIAAIIYFYYLLVIAPLYATHIATNLSVLDSCLVDYKKDKNIIRYTKTSLNAIKKQIQQRIYSGNENYVETEYEAYKDNDKGNDKGKGVEIDIPSIFLIYKNNLARKGSVEDRRQYAREYINYMDEYFALLGRKGNFAADATATDAADYYQAFYLVGLIEYDEDKDITKPDGAIYVLHTAFIKKLKDDIVPKIKIYLGVSIGLYTVMCLAILFLLFATKESMKKMVVEFVYSVSSSKPKIFAIGSVVLIVIALGFTYGILRMVEYIWALKNIFIS